MAKAEFLLTLCLEQPGYNFLLDCLKDLDKSPVCKIILHQNIAKHGSNHGHGTRQLNKRYRSRLIVLRGKPEEQTMGMARFF